MLKVVVLVLAIALLNGAVKGLTVRTPTKAACEEALDAYKAQINQFSAGAEIQAKCVTLSFDTIPEPPAAPEAPAQ